MSASARSMVQWLGQLVSASRRSLAILSVAVTAFVMPAEGASAQQAIVGADDAVVTGLSTWVDGPAPANADPLDYRQIAPDGPSARVIDLSTLGPQGALSPAPKPFTVTAAQVGQVFGVALDDAPSPSIYLAATSAYGVSIGVADASGLRRLHQGAPGATYIPGMFGPPEMGGGPGSIWRVDGTTGQVALFANIGGDGPAPAALGGLAFDPVSQQVFAVDRSSGLIHRLGLDGSDRGTFDHGNDGRAAVGEPPVPASPVAVDITSPDFDTEQPATWDYADPERLVYAVAVHDGRLYYSVAAGPEIWSVGLAPDGSFAGDARFEVAVPVLQPGIEVASIAFDADGLLYAAERAPPTGAYDFRAVATGGDSRVVRFHEKSLDDPARGFWMPEPEIYAIGLAPDFKNANGGAALGRFYDRNNRIDPGTCGTTLWSTGETLIGEGPSIDPVDGIQGNDRALVLPANSPPTQSWFVDYDDKPGDPEASGHMGAIALLPCAGQAATLVPPPVVACPVGTYLVDGVCLLPPRCPPGTRFRDGYCVAVGCPANTIRLNGACVPPPQACGRYETFINGRCEPWACPRNLVRQPNGYCGCPRGEVYARGQCLPPACPPGMLMTRDGRCLPPPVRCERPFVPGPNGVCLCPNGQMPGRNGRCLPPPIRCERPFIAGPNGLCICPPDRVLQNGRCVPPPRPCPPTLFRDDNGRCACPPNLTLQGRVCKPPVVRPCPDGTERGANGICLCPNGRAPGRNGRCLPPPKACPPGFVRGDNGRCACPDGLRNIRGVCKPPVVIDCGPGQQRKGDRCVGVLKPEKPPVVIDCGPGLQLKGKRCVGIEPSRPPFRELKCRGGMIPKDGKCVLPIERQKGDDDNGSAIRGPNIRGPDIEMMVPGQGGGRMFHPQRMMVAPQGQ